MVWRTNVTFWSVTRRPAWRPGWVQQALEMCADDPSVAVVVLTGAGEKAFCAGGDLQGGGVRNLSQ